MNTAFITFRKLTRQFCLKLKLDTRVTTADISMVSYNSLTVQSDKTVKFKSIRIHKERSIYDVHKDGWEMSTSAYNVCLQNIHSYNVYNI